MLVPSYWAKRGFPEGGPMGKTLHFFLKLGQHNNGNFLKKWSKRGYPVFWQFFEIWAQNGEFPGHPLDCNPYHAPYIRTCPKSTLLQT